MVYQITFSEYFIVSYPFYILYIAIILFAGHLPNT